MIKLYKGIFFRLYYRFKKLNLDNSPEYSAISALALAATFNVLTLKGYIAHFIQRKIIVIPKWPSAFIALGFMGLFYLCFIHNNAHTRIYKEFSTSPLWRSVKGDWIVVFYFLLTVLAFVGLIWL